MQLILRQETKKIKQGFLTIRFPVKLKFVSVYSHRNADTEAIAIENITTRTKEI